MKPGFRLSVCVVCLLAISGCKQLQGSEFFTPQKPDTVDPAKNLTRDDYANMLKTQENAQDNASSGVPGVPASFKAKVAPKGPPIPDLTPILAAPQPPRIATTKLVSIAVTDDIPLKDVLMELSRLADVDIAVDAGISGGIVFRAKDRPFNEVIQDIADLAGLRYSMKDGVLHVERDTPYVEIYPISFLDVDRSSQSNISISTNVLSAGGGGGGGGGLNSGGQTSIKGDSPSDFWKKFEDGIKQILSYQPTSRSSGGVAASTAASPAPAAPGGAAGKSGDGSFYIINQQAGTLTVNATQRQQELIKRFIAEVLANASAQVLIEAKIVEVDLNRQFQAGIDWTKLGGGKINFNGNSFAPTILANSTPTLATLNVNEPGLLGRNIDLNLMVNLLDSFGTTRTLASPRLSAINNQQAVLSYAQNFVYFQITVTQAASTTVNGVTNVTPPTINSTVQTVPIGIILSLQPSINLETNEVTLEVRPTYSILMKQIPDPVVALILAENNINDPGIVNNVPEIAVREMDSIVKLKSGQIMVIGGYMEDKAASNDSGLPYVGSIPFLGNLFKSVDREQTTAEMVIFLRATIVDSNGNVPDSDKAFYKKFMQDPHPLNF